MLLGFFAALGVDYTVPTGGKSTGFVMQDMFLIITAGLAVAAILAFCIYFWNKNRRHHHHHHRGSSKRYSSAPVKPVARDDDDEEGATPEEGSASEEGKEHRHRRRRRKHNHRPRNPTLAETGGLPPLRQGDPTDPPL